MIQKKQLVKVINLLEKDKGINGLWIDPAFVFNEIVTDYCDAKLVTEDNKFFLEHGLSSLLSELPVASSWANAIRQSQRIPLYSTSFTRRNLLQNAFNFTFMERISQYIKICKKSTLQKGHPKRMAPRGLFDEGMEAYLQSIDCAWIRRQRVRQMGLGQAKYFERRCYPSDVSVHYRR